MDGDIRARRDALRPGERWGYSATIPANLGQPIGVTARTDMPQPDDAPTRSKANPDAKKGDGRKQDGQDGDEVEGDKTDGKKDEAAPKKPMPRWKKALYSFIGLVILAVIIVAAVTYWLYARQFETTDDAYITGYMSQVSAQASAKVIRLAVADNEEVQAGQVILQLDPSDYQVRLDTANAQRAQAQAQFDQAQADLQMRQANVNQAQAQVRVAQANLGQQQTDLARYKAIDPRAVTRQTIDNTNAQTKSASAQVDANQQAVQSAIAQVKSQRAQVDAAAANVHAADVAIAQAELNLSYTTVLAPQNGRITHRTVDVGNYVNPGQALLSVVSDELWVTANFKETQLASMKKGQHVRIQVDACPGKSFDAHIDSFQAGTGSVFSALPAENATGNYVKVIQRVPVKIVFDNPVQDCRIAPGLSVAPRVTVVQ